MRRFCVAMGRRFRGRAFPGRDGLAGVMILGLAACWAGQSSAEPLGKEACDQLAAERQALTGMGVEENMAKGPEWAAANLSTAALDVVKRYITVSEQLKFRCRAEPVAVAGGPAPGRGGAPVRKAHAARAPHATARALPATAKGPGRPVAGTASQKRHPLAGKASEAGDPPGRRPETINATVY